MIRRREAGIASLLALLGLVTLAAAWLTTALSTRAQLQARRDTVTQSALAEAREALLGYAVRYPDVPGVAVTGGPGRLPCPDLRIDAGEPAGTADAPCASRTGTALGRLPWHTLGLPDLRDGSGAPLFYAVSDAFRSHLAGPINNETGATLALDACAGESAVVAVVFAPGEAIHGQQRGPQATAADFLEGVNAMPDTRCFSTLRDARHNDVLLPLTRADLMRLSERRVRGEVAASLRRYRRAHGPYPWLAPAASPNAQSSVGVALGRLPLRLPDTASADPLQVRGSPGAFDAAFQLSWSMPIAGVLEQSGERPPPPSCVRSSTCDAGLETRIGPDTPSWTGGRCKAQRPRVLSCELTLDSRNAERALVRRRYTVVLDGWPHILTAPAQTRVRAQHFQAAAQRLATTPRAERLQISVRDYLVDDRNAETLQGESRLTLGPGDWVDNFALLEVPFDLEVGGEEIPPATIGHAGSPGALPYWFAANRWHPQIRLGYARANAPGEANLACTRHGAGCLTVMRVRDTARKALRAEAVIVSGGAPLNLHAQRRPSEREADYFEGTNAFAVGSEAPVFEARLDAADFNDGLRLVSPHE